MIMTKKSILAISAVLLMISRNWRMKDWKNLKIFKKRNSCRFRIRTVAISMHRRMPSSEVSSMDEDFQIPIVIYCARIRNIIISKKMTNSIRLLKEVK